MAHAIHMEGDRASMMYAGDEPWHKLGVKLKGPATAAEAIKAANLDWDVTKLDLIATSGTNKIEVPGKYAVVRKDHIGRKDAKVFGIVSKSYSILQNRDAFSFFDTIVNDKKAAIYHTAGALGDGSKVWILAKLPTDIVVADQDVAKKYLLLSNTHDGLSSVQIKFTPVRVVCSNTLNMALSQGDTLRFPHHSDLHQRLKSADEMLGIINSRFDEYEKQFNSLATIQMDYDRLAEYLSLVFPYPADPKALRKIEKAEENRAWAEHFFDEGVGNQQPHVRGTLWAAYNGVTELIDHRVRTLDGKNVITSDSQRLNSIWFGEGAKTKERAYNAATEKFVEWKK